MKKEIKRDLFDLADEKYKEFHSSLCPGTDNIIGVRVPVLRKYAKELSKKYAIDEIMEEIDDEYYEEIMLLGMVIGFQKGDFNVIKRYIVEFVPKIDNWAVCDVFCAGLKFTNKNKKEVWDLLKKYIESDKEFEVRFAVVMILDYFIDEEYIKKDFDIFNSIKCDKYYVKMAIAWAISVCFIKFYEETLEFFKTTQIDDFTFNKSIQKAIESYRISDEQKQFLRGMKR